MLCSIQSIKKKTNRPPTQFMYDAWERKKIIPFMLIDGEHFKSKHACYELYLSFKEATVPSSLERGFTTKSRPTLKYMARQ